MKYITVILSLFVLFMFSSCSKSSKDETKTSTDKKTEDAVKTENKTTDKIAPEDYWKAIEAGDVAKLKSYLEKDPSLVKLTTTDGIDETALAKTAFTGKADIVKLLLEYKADPNAADAYGVTALHGAARTNKAEVIELLIKNKADVNIKKKGTGDTPLHYAAEYNSVDAANKLISLGADKTAKNDEGKTPLDVAKKENSKDVMEVLK